VRIKQEGGAANRASADVLIAALDTAIESLKTDVMGA